MGDRRGIIALGSPRKGGNSTILAGKVREGMESLGARCEVLYLHGMRIGACTACDTCQASMDRFCVMKDDMEPLYGRLLEVEMLVLASPVYWFTVSAQTKLFMDRLYALNGPEGHAMAGKRIGIVLAYGDTDPFTSGAVNALRTFQDAFGYIGASIVGSVYGSALDAGDIAADDELLQRAFELGRQLVQGA